MHVLSMKRRKNAIRIRANFRSQRSLFFGYAFPRRTGKRDCICGSLPVKKDVHGEQGIGVLNSQKMKALRANTANAIAARDAAERREAHEKLNAAAGGTTGAEEHATKVEAELAQVQKEKADLQAKLDANQQ